MCFTFRDTWSSCLVKTERESILSKSTQHIREQEAGVGPSYLHSGSFCGTSVSPFKASQMLPAAPDGLGPHFNLQHPLPFHLLGLGPPLRPPHPQHAQHQLVWALQMQTHLNVSWSNTKLARQTGDKNRCDNHSILDCQRVLPGLLNPSWGK